MTDFDNIKHEIEKGERWLECVANEDELPVPDSQLIRMRVEVERDLEWLSSQVHDRIPSDLELRTKQRVRAELDRIQRDSHVSRPVNRTLRLVSGILAAAAVVAFAAIGILSKTNTSSTEFSSILAFERFSEDSDWIAGVSVLEDDIIELEYEYSRPMSREWEDESLDDIRNTIDRLGSEPEFEIRWSFSDEPSLG